MTESKGYSGYGSFLEAWLPALKLCVSTYAIDSQQFLVFELDSDCCKVPNFYHSWSLLDPTFLTVALRFDSALAESKY